MEIETANGDIEHPTVDAASRPELGGGRFQVRPLRREGRSNETGLSASFALAMGGRQAVCGCVRVNPGALSSSDRKAIKLNLLDNLIGLLPGVPGSDARTHVQRLPVSMELECDSLGKPVIRVGDVAGPSVSFSLGAEMMWAAICREGDCGIDSADPEEFRENYPFHRAFLDDEFRAILDVTGGGRKEASALVWSAKEAAVKALGCGFHLIDPLEVRISFLQSGGTSLSGKAVMKRRFGGKSGWEKEVIVPVMTFRFGNMWISSAMKAGERGEENPW